MIMIYFFTFDKKNQFNITFKLKKKKNISPLKKKLPKSVRQKFSIVTLSVKLLLKNENKVPWR